MQVLYLCLFIASFCYYRCYYHLLLYYNNIKALVLSLTTSFAVKHFNVSVETLLKMGLPLAQYPSDDAGILTPNCICCDHPFCESSRLQRWCRHWFKISWSFIYEVSLSAAIMELSRQLKGCSYDYRCERYIGPSRCRVVIWVCIDPHGADIPHSWAIERMLWPEALGSCFKCLLEENSVVPLSSCALSVAEMVCADIPWTRHLDNNNLFCPTSFSNLLIRTYIKAEIDKCLAQSHRDI